MKTFLFVVCFTLMGVNGYAQTMDTSFTQNNDGTMAMHITATRNFPVRFESVSWTAFSKADLTKLLRGIAVDYREDYIAEIPTGDFPIMGFCNVALITTYQEKNGYIRPKAENLVVEEAHFGFLSVIISALWYFLPIVLVIKGFLNCRNHDNGRGHALWFTFFSLWGILLGIVFGSLLGFSVGLIFGTVMTALATMVAIGIARVERAVPTLMSGTIAGGLTGALAGALSQANFGMGSPEFWVIWRYLIIYAGGCLLAVVIQWLAARAKKMMGPVSPAMSK
jgi:MFS family permease